MSRDILECRCFHNLSFMPLSCISRSDVELIYRMEAEKDFFTMHFGYLMCDKSMVLLLTLRFPEGRRHTSAVSILKEPCTVSSHLFCVGLMRPALPG